MTDGLFGYVHSFEPLGSFDGPGLRTVVFLSGCPMRCKYCHNPDMLGGGGGEKMSVSAVVEKALRYRAYNSGGVTLSGGEPFLQAKPLAELCRQVHARGLDVWCYSGYTYEELCTLAEKDADVRELLDGIDVLIDGRFVLEKLDLKLKFRGSSNQRILDMKKTRERGCPVWLEGME